jgi:hypothetical protein
MCPGVHGNVAQSSQLHSFTAFYPLPILCKESPYFHEVAMMVSR